MSIHDEQDLRARLGTALDELTPSPIPFNAVVRQGRAVMFRRRMTATAAGLAVVAAATLVPSLLHALNRSAPVATGYHVTVSRPGPGSARGLIASGLVNRARWQLTAIYYARQQLLCIASLPGDGDCTGGSPLPTGRSGALASLFGAPNEIARFSDGRRIGVQMLYGAVRRDVSYLRVELSNGQTLLLHPVRVLGSRYASYVALAVPFAAAVRDVIVYSATRELGHAVPFSADGYMNIVRWLRPGQPALPAPAVRSLGSGSTGGVSWSVRAYLGPWGICFESAAVAMDICNARLDALKPGQLVEYRDSAHDGHISLSIVQASPQVSYLTVTRVNGSALRLVPVLVGGHKYWVLPSDDHDHDVTWAAYDAAGDLLSSGPVADLPGSFA